MLVVNKKTASAITLTLLLTSMLTLAFNIQPVKAEGTIYIRADGSIDPLAVPMQSNVLSASSVPPQTEWNKTYGGTNLDVGQRGIQTSDGGYAIAGTTDSYGAGELDFWLVKTDVDGIMQWSRTYGGTGTEEVYDLAQTSDGGYALIGSTDSFGAGNMDFWLIKTDANGNIQLNKTYGGANFDLASSVVQTYDGGYALAGITTSYGAGKADVWLIRTDSNGNAQWNKTYGGTVNDLAYEMAQTADGGYALAGRTDSYGAGGYDFWLVKTDSAGNTQWNKTYGGAADDIGTFIIQTSDGGYTFVGYTDSFGVGSFDSWLIRTDSAGNVQWNKTYGGAAKDYLWSVIQTSEGGYALSGATDSYGAGGYDSWLVKTDSAGNTQWSKTYGGAGYDYGGSHVQTSDGGYSLIGSTNSFGAGDYDFWLVKLGSEYTFPVYTYVIPMDEKQNLLTPDNVAAYGFIWSILDAGANMYRIIEPPDITLKTTTYPESVVYSGGVILVMPTYGDIIEEKRSDFPGVTIDILVEPLSISSDQLFFVEKPTKILVIQGIWGHTEVTLDWMKIPYTLVTYNAIETNATIIHDYDLVVDDCPGWWGSMPTHVVANFTTFANHGGEIIFTDIALLDLAQVFPGYVNVVGNSDWKGNVNIHHPPLTGFPAEFPSQYPATFPQTTKIYTMGGGNIVDTILNTTEVRILMDTSEYGGTNRTLAFYFPYDNGLVEGFAYHPQEQIEGITGDPYSYVVSSTFYGNKFIHAIPTHDVAITNVKRSKTVVGQGYGLNVNVTAANQGDFFETFDVTLYVQSQTTVNETGLVGYWNFDEGSGSTAYDSSGNSNHGTLINGPAWISGRDGGALSFDGINDCVDIAATTSLHNFSQMTIEAWINPKSDGGAVIDRGFYSSPYWTISVGNSMGGMRWNTGQTTNDQGVLQDTTNIPHSTWTHIALALIGIDSTSHNATWYINGQKESSAILPTGLNAITSTSNPLLIGKTSHPMYHGYFNGTIDEVRIYDRALSASEIWTQYTRTPIATQTVTLGSGTSTTLTFTWNTAGFAYGNYTISAYASPVEGETDTDDNTLVDGWVFVTIPGDVNGDKRVNILDCILIANHFGHIAGDGHTPGSKEWFDCANCDINSDSKTNVLDCIILSNNFGKSWP